jgi:hypothetical protein
MKRTIALIRAFLYGVRDGWHQPTYLSTSRNVEHLGYDDDVYNTQDMGINVGQLLRAGTKSEAWQLGYWPTSKFRTLKEKP